MSPRQSKSNQPALP